MMKKAAKPRIVINPKEKFRSILHGIIFVARQGCWTGIVVGGSAGGAVVVGTALGSMVVGAVEGVAEGQVLL